jgi:hypothetical protein
MLMLRVNNRSPQRLGSSLLGGSHSLIGLLLQSHKELIVGYTLARYQSLNLAQPTICPSQMDSRLKLWRESYRRHHRLRCPLD